MFASKVRFILVLVLASLNLQFCAVLLHHHQNNSYYDQKDVLHLINIDCPVLTIQTKRLSPSISKAPNVMIPAKAVHGATSPSTAIRYDYTISSLQPDFGPAALFHNRGSPL